MMMLLVILSLVVSPLTAWSFTTPALVDDCNRTENPLVSGWVGPLDPDITGVYSANGTGCKLPVTVDTAIYWGTRVSGTGDQRLAVDVVTNAGAGGFLDLLVRIQEPHAVTNTVDYYACRWNISPATLSVRKVVNGGTPTVVSTVAGSVAAGDALGCQAVGNTVSVWQQPGSTGDWQLVTKFTDTSSPLTGQSYVGLRSNAGAFVIDNISFGTMTPQRLGLHVTQEELDIWRTRMTAGPYLEDWTRIETNADSFVSTPTAGRWLGNQLNLCWSGEDVTDGLQVPNVRPTRTQGDTLRDAGFAYLLTEDVTYLNAVRAELLTRAALAGTDFANTVKWCPAYAEYASDGNDFEITNYLRKLTYGYSYIRSAISGADRTTLDTWFRNTATYWANKVDNVMEDRYPNQATGNYTCPSCPGATQGLTHFGGYDTYGMYYVLSNHEMAHVAMIAAVAGTLSDPTLKHAAKKKVKEWLMFNVASDGTVADQHRWNGGVVPDSAFTYALAVVGSVITAVDHLARMGDQELYTFSTTAGTSGWGGGPKSLRLVVQRYASIVIGERGLGAGGVLIYASNSATSDPGLRIGPGTWSTQDLWLMPANVYLQEPSVVTAYSRGDMPTCAAVGLAIGGYWSCSGDWGTYPGIRLMFGQMEGIVWPYAAPGAGTCCLGFRP